MSTDTPTPAPAASTAGTAGAGDAPRRPRRRSTSRRHGYGTVRQLPSGRWQARYTDSDGVRRAAPRTFETRQAAEGWITTRRADHITGQWRSPELGAIPLAEYLADQLAGRVDLAPRTRAQYADLARLLVLPALAHPAGRTVELGRVLLRDLTPQHVRDWHTAALHVTQQRIAQRRAAGEQRREHGAGQHPARAWAIAAGWPVKRTGKLSADLLDAWEALGRPAPPGSTRIATLPDRDAGRTTVARAYTLLRSTLSTAYRDGLIPANPCTIKGAGAVKASERTTATPDEVIRLAGHMPDHLRAAVIVAAWSGLRAGELFALTRAHVDLSRGALRVDRALVELPGQPPMFGPPKTATSRRTVHLPGPVVELLAEHLSTHTRPGPRALVFATPAGDPITQSTRQRHWRRARAAEGLDTLRWHDLRHTGATAFARSGATIKEVQARLGHATVEAAMVYQHATAERDRDIAARMGGAITAPLTVATGPQLRSISDNPALSAQPRPPGPPHHQAPTHPNTHPGADHAGTTHAGATAGSTPTTTRARKAQA